MAAGTPVEQIRAQVGETVDTLRVRVEDAAGMAVKLLYAYIGALVTVQERVGDRVAALVNSR